jgi:beta-glucosidase
MPHAHHHKTKYFPKGFLWGASTSAHQVEGNNYNNDWWAAETKGKLKHKSGRSSDHYHLYEQDFDLAAKMNHNAHRMSIEWSRIEPKKGEWNYPEVEHYRKVFESLRQRKIKIMVTLHHFTLPKWFADRGGFEKTRNIRYFIRFTKFMVEQYADLVDMWVTFNEPGVYIWGGYDEGVWPPFKRKKWKIALKVYINLILAHRKAYKIIHKADKSLSDGQTQVGIAQNTISFSAYKKHGLFEQLAVWFLDKITNHGFYIFSSRRTHDFIGINYYFRVRLKRKPGTLKIIYDDISKQGREISDMGFEIYAHGLFDVLMDFRDYNKPIYITENGVSAENDDKRQRFIVSHLNEVYHAIKGGADVRGYFFWSLLDNFEWHWGIAQKFGLVDVNYKTLKRTIKPSGKIYAEIIKENGLEHKMFKLLGHEAKL